MVSSSAPARSTRWYHRTGDKPPRRRRPGVSVANEMPFSSLAQASPRASPSKARRESAAGRDHALEAGNEAHVKAKLLVLEADENLTIKSGGGFIRIDATGIYISGTLVRINSGGSAGSGSGAKPDAPLDAKRAGVEPPAKPEVDDVSTSGLGQ